MAYHSPPPFFFLNRRPQTQWPNLEEGVYI